MLLPVVISTALSAENPNANVNCATTEGRRYINVNGEHISFEKKSKVVLVGAGKASVRFSGEILKLIQDTIVPSDDIIINGTVVTKYEHSSGLVQSTTDALRSSGISVLEAAHPCPDENSVIAAHQILTDVSSATPKDVVIFVLTGGASSLLSLPAPGLTLADIQDVTTQLLRCGASIQEVNTVRKHCSNIAGGHLARVCRAKKLVTFVISDVIGDKLDVIGSGPTVVDPSTFQDALNVLNKYTLFPVPNNVVEDKCVALQKIGTFFLAGINGEHPDTIKVLPSTTQHIVCILRSLTHSTYAVGQTLSYLGVPITCLSTEMEGNVYAQALRLVQFFVLDTLLKIILRTRKCNAILEKDSAKCPSWNNLHTNLLHHVATAGRIEGLGLNDLSKVEKVWTGKDSLNFVDRPNSEWKNLASTLDSHLENVRSNISRFREDVSHFFRNSSTEMKQFPTSDDESMEGVTTPYGFVLGGETTVVLGEFTPSTTAVTGENSHNDCLNGSVEQASTTQSHRFSRKGGRNQVFPLVFALGLESLQSIRTDFDTPLLFSDRRGGDAHERFNTVHEMITSTMEQFFHSLYLRCTGTLPCTHKKETTWRLIKTLLHATRHVLQYRVQWSLMALATDGTDGPTDVAGAVATIHTLREMREAHPEISAEEYLAEDSSYDYWMLVNSKVSARTTTHTGTASEHENGVHVGREWEDRKRNQISTMISQMENSEAFFPPSHVTIGNTGFVSPRELTNNTCLIRKSADASISSEEFAGQMSVFDSVGGIIHTGPTNTNVCDVILLLISWDMEL